MPVFAIPARRLPAAERRAGKRDEHLAA